MFRLGYRELVRMNDLAYSKVYYKPDQWYKVDVLLDWTLHRAAFFIDNEFKASNDFYTRPRDKQKKCDLEFVNALLLYTLSPGQSSVFKDVRLCSDLCPGT